MRRPRRPAARSARRAGAAMSSPPRRGLWCHTTRGGWMLLERKNAVIYGAGGSVGGAVARAFAREGARVWLAGRTVVALDAVAQEIERTGGVGETAHVDAFDEAAVGRHADAIVQAGGSLDVSFNAIAVDHIQGVPLADMSEDEVVGPVAGRVATHLLTARGHHRGGWTLSP